MAVEAEVEGGPERVSMPPRGRVACREEAVTESARRSVARLMGPEREAAAAGSSSRRLTSCGGGGGAQGEGWVRRVRERNGGAIERCLRGGEQAGGESRTVKGRCKVWSNGYRMYSCANEQADATDLCSTLVEAGKQQHNSA